MPDPELIVCDTTFVVATLRAGVDPARTAHWPPATRDRLDAAILAISVISVAELRAGWIYASWASKRVERSERHLRTFACLPLDEDTLSSWARLRAASLAGGWGVGETTCGSLRRRAHVAPQSWRAIETSLASMSQASR